MEAFILQHEPIIRLAFFLGIFVAVATGEVFLPRRHPTQSKKHRWFANVGIVVIDALVIRLLFPAWGLKRSPGADLRGKLFLAVAVTPIAWVGPGGVGTVGADEARHILGRMPHHGCLTGQSVHWRREANPLRLCSRPNCRARLDAPV